MSITATQKSHLNKMNRAAKDVLLGNIVSNLTAGGTIVTGSWAASNAEANASAVVIPTGLSAIRGFIVQPNRSGSPLSAMKIVSTSASLTISTAGSITMAPGDIYNWMVF